MFNTYFNIHRELLKKTYQEDYDLPDLNSTYTWCSMAHSKNDQVLDRHLMVTFWTNADWDIDQTNEIVESSRFPVWFHDKVLFAGREFPNKMLDWLIGAATWKYATPYPNYVNVALTDLCFQMFAEVKDVDQLLEMIRSTCLTDYIRYDLNGDGDTNDTYDGQPETQPLQLINPAWFFQKYLMPTADLLSVKEDETVDLEKAYYLGIVFDIPGAEVKVDGQWLAYNDKNKDVIMDQNPMTLEWRLNANLLRKFGYKQGDTIAGQILVVDDQWNGLTITKDITVKVE